MKLGFLLTYVILNLIFNRSHDEVCHSFINWWPKWLTILNFFLSFNTLLRIFSEIVPNNFTYVNCGNILKHMSYVFTYYMYKEVWHIKQVMQILITYGDICHIIDICQHCYCHKHINQNFWKLNKSRRWTHWDIHCCWKPFFNAVNYYVMP